MQSISTNTMVQPNLVMTICLHNGYSLLTAFSKKVTASGRKTFLPFGILMAFLFWGVAAIAQCPSSIEGGVLTASTNPMCSGQTTSINISVTPDNGGTYSSSFTDRGSFTGLTPLAGTKKTTYPFRIKTYYFPHLVLS